MSRKFLTPIDLNKLEIQNVALQNLASDPSTPATGQIYYNTSGNLKYYNGSSWQTLGTSAGGATLTIGTGLSGTSYNGSTAVTIAIDSTVATLTGSQLLTNKSIAGTGLVFNGSTSGTTTVLASATAGTTTITFPATTGTVVTTGDSGTVTNTMLAGSIANAKLSNSAITINSASTSLGGSVTIYAGTTALQTSSANQALTGISSVTLPGSSSGSVQIIPAAAAGTGTVITFPATTGTVVTTGDSGTVTNTMLAGSIANAKLTNSSVTIGSTTISLGGTSTTLAGLSSVTSTAFVGALTGNASTATTLATARTINGTSFDGSANITVTAAAGTLTGTTLNSTVVSSSLTSVGSLNGLTIASTQTVSMGSNKITNVADPTSPQDAATKNYVDNAVVGIDWKASVRAATTTAGTLATSFANGQAIDGVTLATGDRILIKDQATGSENGIYVVAASGAPTRATDADTAAELTASFAVFVEEGTTNADSGWVLTNNGTITVGTTALTFVQFTGLGQVTAGSGLTKTGNTLNIGAGTGITVNADDVQISATYVGQTSITTLGTITTGTWTGTSIAVLNGGTGATTAAGARTNLGATTKVTGAGSGTGTSISVNHGLGQWVTAQLFDNSTGALVEVDVVNTATASGTTTFTFAASQTLTGFTYVIIG